MQFEDPGRIKVFLMDPNKKNSFKMCKEVLVLWMTKKEVPMYYFKHLYKKDIKNYRDYLAPKEVRTIHASKKLHKSEYTSILSNKLNFALYCEKAALSTPALIGHNFGRSFFSGKGIQKISSKGELVDFYAEIFGATDTQAIFFRPLALNGGQGCFKLDRDGFSQQLEAQFKNLLNGDYTHTEAITQHPDIDDIYSKSINTLRILTYIDGGNIDIISSFIRIGAGGSIVDNGSSGGLFVGIEQESGRLKRTGYRDMKFGGGEFEKHPDSGFRFVNFQVPFFKEACELAIDGARYIPDGFIGWDIALTPFGPTIIEGNEDPHLFMSDLAYGGLLKNLQMKKVMARL
ncbi:sugar-transfer associated ATP-grasp domain-containing protein [Pricia sp.]|uniref:sugar-transfer associated ATP-grasp domain-containing protein n=1 Tax=Pricia sp. TaxID=2268138 RepID=UPI003593C830